LNKQLDRILALAGIFQAAALVKQLAWTGQLDKTSYEASIHSLFQIDANNVVEVYGSIDNLQLGLKTLLQVLKHSSSARDPEIARYCIALLHLEQKLIKKPNMLNIIKDGLARAKNQAEHFGILHQNVIANLASIYVDTLSTFSFRIHITGEKNYLTNTHQTNKVRTLLLAGIRSAVLWHQLGGSRWQLIFQRNSILKDAHYILENHIAATETACN